MAALFDGSPLPLPAPARPFEPLVLTLLSDLVSVPPELGDVLLGGLAAVVLAVRVAEEGRADLAGALLRRAASALEPVRRTGLRLEGVPNAGRTPSPGSDVGHRGAALRWLCTRLEAHLTLPAALRTRLDGAAARLAGVDGLYAARVVSAPPEVRHVHDAVEGCILAAALGDHRPADARAALQRATRAAAALQLTPWSGGPLDLTPSLEALARAPALSPGQWGLYPLLLALAEIGTAVVPPEVAVRWYALELR